MRHVAALILIVGWLGAPAAADDTARPAVGFALGRGGAAAKLAVDLQRELRQVISGRKDLALQDLEERLDDEGSTAHRPLLEEARALLQAGKAAYEEVDLELAQQKLDLARERLESLAAWLAEPAVLRECLVYLGASWVLSGEVERGIEYFSRALDLGSDSGIDRDVFPPDIQEVFERARKQSAEPSRGALSVSIEPLGAEVWVDFAYRGGAPLQVDGLRPGPHVLVARKDGFRRFGAVLTVEAGRARVFRVALKPARDQKAFSDRFAGMAREAFGKGPGTGSAALAEFLGARLLVLLTLDGETSALRLRAFAVEPGSPPRVEQREAANVPAADLSARARELIADLLSADEAAVAAGASGGEANEADGLVLDGAGGEEGGAPGGVAAAGGIAVGENGTGAGSDKAADPGIARRVETPPPPAPWYSFAYLRDKWWFWTAVGVVVVGVAAGIGAAAAPGENQGTLRIRIH
ncbi:MAG: PEGA domain-containing protein [Myxococcales bacterium]|nr:PEGA domain-containing protein [Myxococcales bacterium]